MGGFRTEDDATSTPNVAAGTTTVTVATDSAAPFTFDSGNTTLNVFEAGLFDATSLGNAFAIQNTTSSPNPGIDVNPGDTLAVTWTITVG